MRKLPLSLSVNRDPQHMFVTKVSLTYAAAQDGGHQQGESVLLCLFLIEWTACLWTVGDSAGELRE
jgi:hypothetical protein